MEWFIALSEMSATSSQHDVANSALPDSPVLPYVAPRNRLRRAIAAVREPTRHRHPASPQLVYNARECSTS